MIARSMILMAFLERKTFVMVVCLIEAYIVLGLIYGFSVMYADLVNVFSTSRLNSAFVQGTFILAALGGGIIWTIPIRRFGIGVCNVLGAALGCIGFITSSFARNSQTIIICTGIIGGVGLSMCFLGPFVVANLIYKGEAGFPLTLITVLGSLGQTTMPLFYAALLNAYHWSGTFVVLGAIALQMAPVGFIIHTWRNLFNTSGADSNASPGAVCSKQLLTDPTVWLYFVTVVVLFGTVNFELWFLVDQMVSLGNSREFGTLLLTVLGFANLIGRVIGSLLKLRCKNYPAVYNMFYVCPMIAVGHALIIKLQTLNKWMIAACIVHGLGFGISNAMGPVVMHDLVEHETFMQAVALLNFSFGLGNLLCNFIGGRIRDVSGEYDIAYEIGIAASLLVTFNFVIIACVTRKRQKERASILHNDLKNIPYKTME